MRFISLLAEARPQPRSLEGRVSPGMGLHWDRWDYPALQCPQHSCEQGTAWGTTHRSVVSMYQVQTSPQIHPTDQKGAFMAQGPGMSTAIQEMFLLGWCTSHGDGINEEHRRIPGGGGGTNPHTTDLSNSTSSSQLLKSITYNANKSKWPGKPTWLCLDTSHNSFI